MGRGERRGREEDIRATVVVRKFLGIYFDMVGREE